MKSFSSVVFLFILLNAFLSKSFALFSHSRGTIRLMGRKFYSSSLKKGEQNIRAAQNKSLAKERPPIKILIPAFIGLAGLNFDFNTPLLKSLVAFPQAACAADVASSTTESLRNENIATPRADSASRTVTLPSGVQYFDVQVGTDGPVAEEGRSVQFLWVLRRSNGYFVDASSNYNNEPFIYKVGNAKKVIKGLDEGIRGMRAGGIRRLNIPPNVAFVEGVGDGKPGPMPADFGPRRQILTRIDREVWYFEIKLLKVK